MTYSYDLIATVFVLPIAFALVSFPAAAASITHVLQTSNESTALSDPADYLSVTLEEVADDIRFSVATLGVFASDPFDEGANFGMQTFGFNIDDAFPGDSLDAENIEFLTPGLDWRVTSGNLSQFGHFDVVLSWRGNTRLDKLVFLITGIDGDGISTYAALRCRIPMPVAGLRRMLPDLASLKPRSPAPGLWG